MKGPRRNSRFISVRRRDGTRYLVEKRPGPRLSTWVDKGLLKRALADGEGEDYDQAEDYLTLGEQED